MADNITMIVICGDTQLDAMMHAADLFQSDKALARVAVLTGTLKDGETLETACQKTVKALQSQPERFRLVACFVPGTPIGYVDETVKVISDGNSFSLLSKILSDLGYMAKPITDDVHHDRCTSRPV